jgi:Domain of unknown function (DUF4411)
MSAPPIYALDANVLIQAKDAYYRFSFCPAFWDFLPRACSEGHMLSIDKIHTELSIGGDALANYANAKLGNDFFRDSGEADVIAAFAQLVIWVNAQPQFSPSAKGEFASGVDGWLIAYAKVHGCIVVTQETLAPDAKRRVPIPNVCIAASVGYCNTFEMLESIRPQFMLAP